MTALAALRDQFARLQLEARANPRLGAILLLVPAVAALWLALVTRDAIDAAREERTPLERRAARLAQLAGSGEWEREIAAGETEFARWESQAWRAASADLAAADLQTALRGIMAEHLSWNRLKLAPTEELRALGGWRISADVSGKLRDPGILPLLQALAEHSPAIRVEKLQFSSQRGMTLSLTLGIVVLPEQTP